MTALPARPMACPNVKEEKKKVLKKFEWQKDRVPSI